MISKVQLRREIEPRRRALSPTEVAEMSTGVVDLFKELQVFKTAKIVALYRAIAGEVNLAALFQTCWDLQKRTCIPVFKPATKTYEMTIVSAETTYSTGHYGIQEPDVLEPIALKDVDLIAVPGVAFDGSGNRLGRGGGYYDCLLSGFPGATAGVAFDFQLLHDVPVEAHDHPVDWIVTPYQIKDSA